MTTKVKHIANNVVTDNQIDLSTIDTGEIAEGSNLYFTNTRVDSRLSGGSLGAISHNQGYTQTAGTWQKQGTNGNVTIASNGNELAFSRNGANYIDAPGSSGSIQFRTGSSYATAVTINSSQDTTFNGDVTITGQLSITGNIDQYNVTDLDVTDKTITLGSGQNAGSSGGSGILIDGSLASILWDQSSASWDFNKKLDVRGATGGGTLTHALFTGTNGRGFEIRTRSDISGGQHSGTAELNSKDHEGTGGDIALSSNGNVRVFVDGGGNVGIGRTDPGYALDVKAGDGDGTARFLNSAGEDTLVRIIGGNYNTELDARLFLGESDTYGMTIEYDGVANIGYIGMNDNVSPTASFSKRIGMSRGGTEVFFTAGKVGVGTSNPQDKLHVYNGDVGIENSSGRRYRLIAETNGNFTIRDQSAAAGRFHINTSGHVGINRSAPDYPFHMINPQDTNQMFRVYFPDSATTQIGTSRMSTGATQSLFVEAQSGVRFGISGTEYGRFHTNGKFGVGTTVPTAPVSIRAQHATGYGSGMDMLDFKAYYPPNYDTETSKASIFVGTSDKHTLNTHGGYLAFRVNQSGFSGSGATNLVEAMRIEKDGNVGIGTTSASTRLHLKKTGSTSAVNEFIRIENSAGGGAAAGSSIHFHHYHAGGGPAGGAKAASITAQNMASWPGGSPSSYSTGLTFGTLHENSFDERMRIDSSGKVGIGTTSPGAVLEISGKDDTIGGTDLLRLQFDNSPADTGITFTDIFSGVKARFSLDSGNTNDVRISAGTQIGFYSNTTNGSGTPTVLIANDGRLDVDKHIEVGFTTEDSSLTGGLVFDTPRYREYHFNWSGLTNHQVEMTCSSYFMAIVEYMTFQTNGGADIQEYHRGKWANNHTTHTWDEFESSGNTGAISNTITAGQNNVSNSGKLTIAETYGSGSYSGSSLIVRVYFGDSGFAISKTT